jgi:hypothetical protein
LGPSWDGPVGLHTSRLDRPGRPHGPCGPLRPRGNPINGVGRRGTGSHGVAAARPSRR